MPELARLDAPGGLHHIIFRGIERRKIFRGQSGTGLNLGVSLQLFGKSRYAARKKYRDFVEKGIGQG